MIGKVTKGASFYHCLAYCLEDKRKLTDEEKQHLTSQEGLQHKDRSEVLEYNLCYGDKYELASQFRDVEKLSRRAEKPVLHLMLRSATGDQLTQDQWREIGRAAAQEFGVSDHQYIIVLHKDTKQPHIHVVANRVGYDGRVASDSNSYGRMAALCRKLEKQYHLQTVLSPRRFQTPEQRQQPRQDLRKEQLKKDIRDVLQGTLEYAEFERKIKAKGYQVDKGRGIAFEDEKKVRIKGSEVGYSWQNIERILLQNKQLQQQSQTQNKVNPDGVRPAPSNTSSAHESLQHSPKMRQPGHGPTRAGETVVGKIIEKLMEQEEELGPAADFYEQEEERQRQRQRHR